MRLILAFTIAAAFLIGATIPTSTENITGRGGKKATAHRSDKKDSCRLVYDNGKVIAVFHGVGVTHTIHQLFQADTDAECQAQITALKLTPLPSDPHAHGPSGAHGMSGRGPK